MPSDVEELKANLAIYQRCADLLFDFARDLDGDTILHPNYDGLRALFAQWAESALFQIVWSALLRRQSLPPASFLNEPGWGLDSTAVEFGNPKYTYPATPYLSNGGQEAMETIVKLNPSFRPDPKYPPEVYPLYVRGTAGAVGFLLAGTARHLHFLHCDPGWDHLGFRVWMLQEAHKEGYITRTSLLAGMTIEALRDIEAFCNQSGMAIQVAAGA